MRVSELEAFYFYKLIQNEMPTKNNSYSDFNISLINYYEKYILFRCSFFIFFFEKSGIVSPINSSKIS